MSIRLNIASQLNLVEQLAERLGVGVEGDKMLFPNHVGCGYHQRILLPGELSLYCYDFSLHMPLSFRTISRKENGTYCIFINALSTPIEKTVGEQPVAFSRHGSNGIFFYSPNTSASVTCQPGERYLLLALTFQAATLETYSPDEDLRSLLDPGREFAYFEEIDLVMEQYIDELCKEGPLTSLRRLRLHGQALLLMEHLLRKVLGHQSERNVSGLLKEDIEKLFQVRKVLTLQYEDPPTITQLSRQVAMSETRLKKYFKQLFGRPLYQYAQYARMLKAKELLESRCYNVSEVGIMTGYTNLTHFAEAFKKYFEVNPSQYLATIMSV
jgi:AraC-like DNA-binding protein